MKIYIICFDPAKIPYGENVCISIHYISIFRDMGQNVLSQSD